MRAIELFAGIGGFSAACPDLEVVAAIDIDRDAATTYRLNFDTPYFVREIESLPFHWLASFQADLWWMSPPCTPFSRRGNRKDLADARCKALLHLIDAVAAVRPSHVLVENVEGFESSQAFERLHTRWTDCGYTIRIFSICPSQWNWPNRRPRVYLVCSLEKVPAIETPTTSSVNFFSMLDRNITSTEFPDLYLDTDIIEGYGATMDILDCTTPQFIPVSACFASSYGKTILHAGSYVRDAEGVRRFSPREVARLLGFEDSFRLPDTLSTRRLWHQLGNSLSLPAVRAIASSIRSVPIA